MTGADRVMRARKTSICGYCAGVMNVGEQIALYGDRWQHVACVLAQQQAVTQQDWSDAYQVSEKERRRRAADAALSYLRASGTQA